MRWMLEFCQSPKGLARDIACHKVFHVIPNLIISHGSFDYVIVMFLASSTVRNEIKPFVGHLRKRLHSKSIFNMIVIERHDMLGQLC